ncbi:hypothetical protein ACLKA6_005738 [Drosophila palustris]
MEEEERRVFERRSALQRTPPTPQVFLSPTKSPEKNGDVLPTTLEGALSRMGEVLESLTSWFKTQRYITAARRDEIIELSCLQHLAIELSSPNLASTEVQTTPTIGSAVSLKNAAIKRATGMSAKNSDTPKRQRDPTWEPRKTPPKKSKSQNMAVHVDAESRSSAGKSSEHGKWTKVNGRQRLRERIRSDAIAVSGVGDCSYSEILKIVKSDPSLKHLSGDVKSIRKATNGDLLLKLDKNPAHTSDVLKDAVSKALGSRAVVKKLTETAQVEIRDLDELVSREEVVEAVKLALNDATVSQDSVKSLRALRDGQQVANLILPAAQANVLADLRKIRIGWVVCRIRTVLQPKRCFKCLAYGHMAANCSSTEDLKGACFKCGERGHLAKTCVKPPKSAGANWQISDVYTASDHVAILTTIGDHSRPAGNGVPHMQAYRVEQFNSQLFTAALQSVATEGSAEDRARQITCILANACDSSMPRRKTYRRHHEPTFWWNERIANARHDCLHARRRYQRSRGRPDFNARQDAYREARRKLKREIRSSKRECFLKLCDSAEHDPWGKAYKTSVHHVGEA